MGFLHRAPPIDQCITKSAAPNTLSRFNPASQPDLQLGELGGELVEAMRRAEREWIAILTAVKASHGSYLLDTGKTPEIGSLVAIPGAYLPNTQHQRDQWTYGLRVGPGASNRDTSLISRISLS